MQGHPRYTKEEIAKKAHELYVRQIRSQVEPAHIGEFLCIDIETGDYEVDADYFAASDRAAERRPGAPLYSMRIGYSSMGRIGFVPTRSVP